MVLLDLDKVVTNAALSVVVVGYFISVFPASTTIPPPVMTVAFMWLFVGVNLLGVKSGGRVQVITSLLKIVPLVLVMVLGGAAILMEPAAYTANLPTTPPVGLQPSMAAATIALYAMLGFESATIASAAPATPSGQFPAQR